LLAAFLIVASLATAQTSVSTLSFLAGRWVAQGADEQQEEIWSPPVGANVVGSFRVVQSGRAVFFEFWSVEERDGKAVMLLKHYNAPLKGWEEKDAATELPLVKSGPFMAEFSDGKVTLHYERHGEYLTATVTHTRDGKVETESFRLKKAAIEAR